MIIEVLFPEICNLYGDMSNIRYLQKSCAELEIVETGLKEKPYFADHDDVAMIYMGTTSEKGQALAVQALQPYKERIEQLIRNQVVFLITGNAMEVFGQYIENEDKSRVPCLGLFDVYATRKMLERYNSLYLGKFGEMDIVGFKSLFGHSYGDNSDMALFDTVRGAGLNPETKGEGLRRNNFMATYITGPLLVLNPPFAKYILELIGVENPKLAFEETAMDVYNTRVKEFSDPNTGFIY